MRKQRVVAITLEVLICDCCRREFSGGQSDDGKAESVTSIRLDHAMEGAVECDLCDPCIRSLLADYLRASGTLQRKLTAPAKATSRGIQSPTIPPTILAQIEF